MKKILTRLGLRAAVADSDERRFRATLVRAYGRKAPNLERPKIEIRESEIYIESYPYSHSSLSAGKVAIPSSRITAIFHSLADAAFVLDKKETIFLAREQKQDLQAFASRHNIPCPRISEVWSDLAEPYLDNECSEEDEARTLVRLVDQGYDRHEVLELRARIAGTMQAASFFTMEWGLYTSQDVLRAFALISPEQLTGELYWKVMEVALRPYRAIDPEASRRLAALKSHWDGAWEHLRLSPPPGTYCEVTGRYLEPHRFYHTLRHMEECFALFGDARSLCAHPDEVLLALWFHDAVYRPTRQNNEEASARWAEAILRQAGVSSEIVGRVGDLILATRHDAEPASDDASVLVDLDLSILASDPARFDEYETQVRREYAHIPDRLFRMGRTKILNQFLARTSIYSTGHFKERFETRARENIARSLARL